MLEKILQKMKTQRGTTSNVSDRTLTDLATTVLPTITTEEQLEAIDFTPIIKSLDGNISSYTAGAVKKVNDEKDAKIVELEGKKKEPAKKDEKQDEEAPQWAKELMQKNEALEKQLQAMTTEKQVGSRKEKVSKLLEGLPEFYTTPINKAFDRMQFATDEDFETYVTELGADKDKFIQTAKEMKLPNYNPAPKTHVEEESGETDILKQAREMAKKKREAEQAQAQKQNVE